jgi:hypothetical protein
MASAATARTTHPTTVLMVALVLLLGACTGGGGRSGDLAGAATDDDRTTSAGSVAADPCRRDALEAGPIVTLTGPDPAATSAAVASRTHRCSDTVVVAVAGDGWGLALAAAAALAADAPLLVLDPGAPAGTVTSLVELEADEAVIVGLGAQVLAPGDDAPGFEGTVTALTVPAPPASTPAEDDTTEPATDDPATGDPAIDEPATDDPADGDAATPAAPDAPAGLPAETRLALAVADHLGASHLVAVPLDDHEARAAVTGHLEPGDAVLPLPDPPTGLASELPAGARVTVLASDTDRAAALTEALLAAGVDATAHDGGLWSTARTGTAWLVDPRQPEAAAVAGTAAAARGDALRPIDADDLRRGRDWTMGLRDVAPDRAVLLGVVGDHADWQLPLLLEGSPLPGGGFTLFENERMVALYGHPASTVLGALGEQDLDATVERARRVAEPYGADGARILPAFEIIATVASREAGALGDYSRRTAIDVLRPHVDRAAAEGFYVILDLQPGRTDFLTQAKEYEELLLLPHVGLALDPEWRLKPNQVHLVQIGSVEAAEVQQVADWLAALTRDNLLPEKLLILHQFRFDMLPDRDTIVAPPELAVVVHMDGQGPIGAKDGTYRAITQGAEDRWLWGWKNFYDEDSPTPTPDHVLSRDPLPVFVSYQ